MNEFVNDTYNATITNGESPVETKNVVLKTAFDVAIIGVQVVIMVSMGVIISIKEVINHLKKPIGVGIALVCQFVLMPASSFGIISLMQLSKAHSLSAMILACCPGGSASNLFTYFCGGDVSLSITLTTISTTLALGMMPLNLWIYTKNWTQDTDLQVPYKGIALTLAWILLPLGVGLLIKKWLPKLAAVIRQFGGALGMLVMWSSIIMQYFLYPQGFHQSYKLWLVAAFIPTAGFFIGLIFSFLLRQNTKNQRTIAIETGMQSISLAVTVIITSFPSHLHGDMSPLPTMSGVFLNAAGFILALSIYSCKKIRKRKISITEPEKNCKQVQVISTIS